MAAPTSALKMTWPSSIRANALPERTSSATRARYEAPPSPASGETPTSSVNMAMEAGSRTSSSSRRTRLTAGSGAIGRRAVDRHQRLRGAHVTGRPPVRAEEPPQLADRGGRPDDGRAAPSLAQRPVGERGDGRRGGLHGDQVGSAVAQRHQPAALLEAPHLGAESPGIEPEGPDPRLDEHVRHRVDGADCKGRRPVAVVQQPRLVRALPNAQHIASLAADSNHCREGHGLGSDVGAQVALTRPGLSGIAPVAR